MAVRAVEPKFREGCHNGESLAGSVSCRCDAQVVEPRFIRSTPPIARCRLNCRQKNERGGYHKPIGNAVALPCDEQGRVPSRSGSTEDKKGVAVRQALARFIPFRAHPIKALMTIGLAVAIGMSGAGDAFAARKKARASAASPKYAAIVIDANTGKTLFASSADAARYPASLTKMMTLYMVFEALQRGKISEKTKIPFSAQASAKPPTKLGVKAGGTVTVETIIYSLVTKSANDSAAAVAEYLGGTEEGFARMMTTKAQRLGMSNTVFKNASGLPDTAQYSTARDMAILGIALREHFPQYYDYFSTRSFSYGKQRMANHNRLLGRVKGVDGIKTGYTRASGFNLVSSVSTGGKKVVAVVMGGQTGRSRDNHMAELIRKYLPKASGRDGGDLVAKAAPVEMESKTVASAAPVTASVLPKKNAPKPVLRPSADIAAAKETVRETTEVATLHAYAASPDTVDPIETSSTGGPDGWAVQVGSSPSASEAKGMLAKAAKIAPRAVAGGSPFTVEFEKDGTTYHRARFGGFGSKTAAWDACNALKKKKIDCYAVQQ